VVRQAQDNQVRLSQVPLAQLQNLSDLFQEDVASVFDFDAAVARRRAPGGTAPEAVREQIAQARAWLASCADSTS
jgi:argininosuccinate lyase